MSAFLKRWPSLERAAYRSPIVRACMNLADRGRMSEPDALAAAVRKLEEQLETTRAAYLDLHIRMPPPPFTAPDGRVCTYVGPCAVCGREGPVSPPAPTTSGGE